MLACLLMKAALRRCRSLPCCAEQQQRQQYITDPSHNCLEPSNTLRRPRLAVLHHVLEPWPSDSQTTLYNTHQPTTNKQLPASQTHTKDAGLRRGHAAVPKTLSDDVFKSRNCPGLPSIPQTVQQYCLPQSSQVSAYDTSVHTGTSSTLMVHLRSCSTVRVMATHHCCSC